VAGRGVGVKLGVSVGTRVVVAVGKGVGVSVGTGVKVRLGDGVGLGRVANFRVGVAVGVAVTSILFTASQRVRPEPKAVKATNPHEPPSKRMTRAMIQVEFLLFKISMSFHAIDWGHYTIGLSPEPTLLFLPESGQIG
jgi:hypothetical protein